MLVTVVAGARPNFMKIGPIIKAIKEEKQRGNGINYRLVHTGQHYDKKMSGDFFEELGIPDPDVNLESGGGTQAEQTAAIMVKFEKDLVRIFARCRFGSGRCHLNHGLHHRSEKIGYSSCACRGRY
jgi:UDP-N-acetylglucosamine 2-epimerase (non-hydrolysing)